MLGAAPATAVPSHTYYKQQQQHSVASSSSLLLNSSALNGRGYGAPPLLSSSSLSAGHRPSAAHYRDAHNEGSALRGLGVGGASGSSSAHHSYAPSSAPAVPSSSAVPPLLSARGSVGMGVAAAALTAATRSGGHTYYQTMGSGSVGGGAFRPHQTAPPERALSFSATTSSAAVEGSAQHTQTATTTPTAASSLRGIGGGGTGAHSGAAASGYSYGHPYVSGHASEGVGKSSGGGGGRAEGVHTSTYSSYPSHTSGGVGLSRAVPLATSHVPRSATRPSAAAFSAAFAAAAGSQSTTITTAERAPRDYSYSAPLVSSPSGGASAAFTSATGPSPVVAAPSRDSKAAGAAGAIARGSLDAMPSKTSSRPSSDAPRDVGIVGRQTAYAYPSAAFAAYDRALADAETRRFLSGAQPIASPLVVSEAYGQPKRHAPSRLHVSPAAAESPARPAPSPSSHQGGPSSSEADPFHSNAYVHADVIEEVEISAASEAVGSTLHANTSGLLLSPSRQPEVYAPPHSAARSPPGVRGAHAPGGQANVSVGDEVDSHEAQKTFVPIGEVTTLAAEEEEASHTEGLLSETEALLLAAAGLGGNGHDERAATGERVADGGEAATATDGSASQPMSRSRSPPMPTGPSVPAAFSRSPSAASTSGAAGHSAAGAGGDGDHNDDGNHFYIGHTTHSAAAAGVGRAAVPSDERFGSYESSAVEGMAAVLAAVAERRRRALALLNDQQQRTNMNNAKHTPTVVPSAPRDSFPSAPTASGGIGALIVVPSPTNNVAVQQQRSERDDYLRFMYAHMPSRVPLHPALAAAVEVSEGRGRAVVESSYSASLQWLCFSFEVTEGHEPSRRAAIVAAEERCWHEITQRTVGHLARVYGIYAAPRRGAGADDEVSEEADGGDEGTSANPSADRRPSIRGESQPSYLSPQRAAAHAELRRGLSSVSKPGARKGAGGGHGGDSDNDGDVPFLGTTVSIATLAGPLRGAASSPHSHQQQRPQPAPLHLPMHYRDALLVGSTPLARESLEAAWAARMVRLQHVFRRYGGSGGAGVGTQQRAAAGAQHGHGDLTADAADNSDGWIGEGEEEEEHGEVSYAVEETAAAAHSGARGDDGYYYFLDVRPSPDAVRSSVRRGEDTYEEGPYEDEGAVPSSSGGPRSPTYSAPREDPSSRSASLFRRNGDGDGGSFEGRPSSWAQQQHQHHRSDDGRHERAHGEQQGYASAALLSCTDDGSANGRTFGSCLTADADDDDGEDGASEDNRHHYYHMATQQKGAAPAPHHNVASGSSANGSSADVGDAEDGTDWEDVTSTPDDEEERPSTRGGYSYARKGIPPSTARQSHSMPRPAPPPRHHDSRGDSSDRHPSASADRSVTARPSASPPAHRRRRLGHSPQGSTAAADAPHTYPYINSYAAAHAGTHTHADAYSDEERPVVRGQRAPASSGSRRSSSSSATQLVASAASSVSRSPSASDGDRRIVNGSAVATRHGDSTRLRDDRPPMSDEGFASDSGLGQRRSFADRRPQPIAHPNPTPPATPVTRVISGGPLYAPRAEEGTPNSTVTDGTPPSANAPHPFRRRGRSADHSDSDSSGHAPTSVYCAPPHQALSDATPLSTSSRQPILPTAVAVAASAVQPTPNAVVAAVPAQVAVAAPASPIGTSAPQRQMPSQSAAPVNAPAAAKASPKPSAKRGSIFAALGRDTRARSPQAVGRSLPLGGGLGGLAYAGPAAGVGAGAASLRTVSTGGTPTGAAHAAALPIPPSPSLRTASASAEADPPHAATPRSRSCTVAAAGNGGAAAAPTAAAAARPDASPQRSAASSPSPPLALSSSVASLPFIPLGSAADAAGGGGLGASFRRGGAAYRQPSPRGPHLSAPAAALHSAMTGSRLAPHAGRGAGQYFGVGLGGIDVTTNADGPME